MRRIFTTAAKLGAIGALLLAGSSCTSTDSTFATPDLGGVWPGWEDIDEGGFEERGWVLFPEFAQYGSKGKSLLYGSGDTSRVIDYEFYRQREGLARLCPFRHYVPITVSGNVANRIVLDQAATSGGMVHISGRQRSGLRPGAAYVEVMRVNPVKPAKRIAW